MLVVSEEFVGRHSRWKRYNRSRLPAAVVLGVVDRSEYPLVEEDSGGEEESSEGGAS